MCVCLFVYCLFLCEISVLGFLEISLVSLCMSVCARVRERVCVRVRAHVHVPQNVTSVF